MVPFLGNPVCRLSLFSVEWLNGYHWVFRLSNTRRQWRVYTASTWIHSSSRLAVFHCRLIPRTLGPFNVFILLNGWIYLHGVLDQAGRVLVDFQTHLESMHFHSFIHAFHKLRRKRRQFALNVQCLAFTHDTIYKFYFRVVDSTGTFYCLVFSTK